MKNDSPITCEPTTKLCIDLRALRHNYRTLSRRSDPATVHAVVKANAYGLGVQAIAPVLWDEGCRAFYVASLDEGIDLRRILPEAQISVFYGPLPGEAGLYETHRLIPVLNTFEQIRLWQNHPVQDKEAILHIDTGMNRLGLPPQDVRKLAQSPNLLEGLKFTGIISHLACADEPNHPQNAQQLSLFHTLSALFPGVSRSLAASYGIYLGHAYLFEATRPGAALYGIVDKDDLLPVISLKSRILQLKDVPAESPIGYGATYKTSTSQRIATLSLGYSSGYLRTGSGAGLFTLQGTPVPTVGRVSMDLITVDVTDVKVPLEEGQWVDLIGPDNPIGQFSHSLGTIPYELLLTLGRSLTPIYET